MLQNNVWLNLQILFTARCIYYTLSSHCPCIRWLSIDRLVDSPELMSSSPQPEEENNSIILSSDEVDNEELDEQHSISSQYARTTM